MYQIPELPYLYQDLEPYIDTHTMGLHYNKHEKGYLNNLNRLLLKNKYNYQYDIEEIIYHIDSFQDKEDILFNLGGVLNHELFWLSINKNRVLPFGKLRDDLYSIYGDFDGFWSKFKEMALKLKGAGYTFLVINSNGNLEIINVMNQDIPLLYGYIPLFNVDLWEHVYYINYENDRSRYLDNLKEIVDFSNASNIYNNMF